VLFVASPDRETQIDPAVEAFLSELRAAGVPFRMIERSGCMKQEIIDYTRKEHDVLFVVVESPGSLDADCRRKDGVLTELWKNLSCPLVVVTDQAGA
jgi:hypothetical protein